MFSFLNNRSAYFRETFNTVKVENDVLVLGTDIAPVTFKLTEKLVSVLISMSTEMWKRENNSETVGFINKFLQPVDGYSLENKWAKVEAFTTVTEQAVLVEQWKLNANFNFQKSVEDLHKDFHKTLSDLGYEKAPLPEVVIPTPQNVNVATAPNVANLVFDEVKRIAVEELKAAFLKTGWTVVTPFVEEVLNKAFTQELLEVLVNSKKDPSRVHFGVEDKLLENVQNLFLSDEYKNSEKRNLEVYNAMKDSFVLLKQMKNENALAKPDKPLDVENMAGGKSLSEKKIAFIKESVLEQFFKKKAIGKLTADIKNLFYEFTTSERIEAAFSSDRASFPDALDILTLMVIGALKADDNATLFLKQFGVFPSVLKTEEFVRSGMEEDVAENGTTEESKSNEAFTLTHAADISLAQRNIKPIV